MRPQYVRMANSVDIESKNRNNNKTSKINKDYEEVF